MPDRITPDPVVLGFDTSAAHCAAALLRGDAVLAAVHEDMTKGQAERLMPMLEEMLAGAGLGWGDLDVIGVGTGPGNFTGIRVAVAAARGQGTRPLRVFPDIDAPVRARMRVNALSEPVARLLVERGVHAVDGGLVWCSDPRLTIPTAVRMTPGQVDALIAGIECPTRVIYADPPQPYLPEPDRSRRARLLPDGELTVIAGGHHLHMEQPDEVAGAIGDFLLR